MRSICGALAGVLAITTPAAASEIGWFLRPAAGDLGEQLIYESGRQYSYIFTCEAASVAITQIGVTELLDLRTNARIGDGPDARMSEGAALMALYSGKGTPNFQPATSAQNPDGGWNLTIRLAKNDKQLRAIGSSEMISLFTTGYTAAVAIDSATRATWKGFLTRCQSTS